MKPINVVKHAGKQWVTVRTAAEMAQLSEAAIYKAIRLGQLESTDVLGVKSVSVKSIHERWPQTEEEEA